MDRFRVGRMIGASQDLTASSPGLPAFDLAITFMSEAGPGGLIAVTTRARDKRIKSSLTDAEDRE
ncbi:hypothetical protein [Zavarzinella formosa]|uniref:hypothetical protein n=1 Tax=Zavarzinella formosa TaxID=360055 RepID=UPI0002EA4482|nr:hypothetical protein [Zavarzinella formosa]